LLWWLWTLHLSFPLLKALSSLLSSSYLFAYDSCVKAIFTKVVMFTIAEGKMVVAIAKAVEMAHLQGIVLVLFCFVICASETTNQDDNDVEEEWNYLLQLVT